MTWLSAASALEEPRIPLRTPSETVLDVLRARDGELSILEISSRSGLPGRIVASELFRLTRRGQVEFVGRSRRRLNGDRVGGYRASR